jgi:serine/threonine-protein kinase
VYRAGGTPAGGPLVVRALDALDTRQLGGVALARGPFFSPDSRWVGFFESGELKKISITGGTAVTLCPAIGGSRGASWGDDNTIVFATGDPATGLRRVSADGGESVVLTTPDAARNEEDHLFPSILPGGRGVLFTITAPGSLENAQVAVLDSRSGAQKTLVRGGSHPEYVESGHLVYASAGALRAVPFDPARLELAGDPVPVVEQVLISANGAANYAVSRQGTLVYVPAGMTLQTPRSLVWVDRTGREAPLKAPVRGYSSPRVSPDGTRVAVGSEGDIWIWDLTREALTRLTADPGLKQQPVWTLDSRRVIFASSRAGEPNLYVKAADGTGAVERLTTSANPQVPNSVTPDGTRVVIYEIAPKTARDLVVLPLPGASESRETRLIQTAFDEWNADVSPNGRFIAYQSNESGRPEIYVRPFPAVDAGRWVVSTSGGTAPVWAKNGRELFYLDAANALTATPVQTSGSTFSAGLPVKLFDSAYSVMIGQRQYDVSSDGKRFLMLKDKPTGDQPPAGIVVVLNWFDDLNRSLHR